LEGRTRGALFFDQQKHRRDVAKHLFRRDSKRADALSGQPGIPPFITRGIVPHVVGFAVHFDAERGARAIEVQ
jgi:hypothetical protein